MAYTRLIRAYYHHEKPIPADLKDACRIARATTPNQKRAVDIVLREFFVLESDGWHQKRCDAEITKYLDKKPAAEEKKENDKERQKRARERRKALFEELSSRGINMPWNATTEQLQTELSRVTSSNLSQPVTQPVTRDNTATQTPDTRHQTPDLKPNPVESHTVSTDLASGSGQPPPVSGQSTPFATGAACLAIKSAGITTTNPSHPTLIALCEAGADAAEFGLAAREAVAKGKPDFAYVLGMVRKRREDAAKLTLHKGRMPNKQEALEASNKAATAGWTPPELRGANA